MAPPIVNPYAKKPASQLPKTFVDVLMGQDGKQKAPGVGNACGNKPKKASVGTGTKAATKSKQQQRTYLEVMMGQHKKGSVITEKKRASTSQDSISPLRPPPKSIRSRLASAARSSKGLAATPKVDDDGDDGDNDAAAQGSGWTKHTRDFCKSLASAFKSQIGFEQRGKHELVGSWPSIHVGRTIQPSSDPISWQLVFSTFCGTVEEPATLQRVRNVPMLSREDFSLPDVMIWAPELRWPHLYPAGRPHCKWHCGAIDCVIRNGLSHYPRRCYDIGGNTALFGYRYVCKIRRTAADKPYSFFSYDEGVIAASDPFVVANWQENGFTLTARAGIRTKMVEQGRSLLANGSGAAGFHKSIVEQYKQVHWNRRKSWRGYVADSKKFDRLRKERELFFNFEDSRAELSVPSMSYVLQNVLKSIAKRIPYYTLRMQMCLGRCLSGDHSHKVAKVVLVNGERSFEGIYTVMNEFGKIMGFWFVNGTTLAEVEDVLRGINRRYKLHGIVGPIMFSTDRCCQERSFFTENQSKGNKPVFDSFEMPVGTKNDSENGDGTPIPEQTFIEERFLSLPSNPYVIRTSAMAQICAGKIMIDCDDNKWGAIAIDSEWTVDGLTREKRLRTNKNVGPDVLQICLPNGATYVFMIRKFSAPPPPALKTLLQSMSIRKVAHNISSDRSRLGEIGVSLEGGIELGIECRKRGVVDRANVRLEQIVETLFDCKMKKENSVRLSNWTNDELTAQQVKYAAIDAYAHMMCYLKLLEMPFVDPSVVVKPSQSDLQPGAKVLLYTTNRSAVVAGGIVVGPATKSMSVPAYFGSFMLPDDTLITLRISRAEVRRPMAIAKRENGANTSFNTLFEKSEESETPGIITIPWKIRDLRIDLTEESACNNVVTVQTEIVRRPAAVETPVIQNDPSQSLHSSPERVKNDILHIFQRLSKVLSKRHGAFRAFMSRLSDAFYHPSVQDVAFIKEVLKKAGLTDKEIAAKPWQYYKRRVRRHVPRKHILEADVTRVVNLFADVKDAKTGQPLFNKDAWAVYQNIIKHIRKNCLSDEAGICYYIHIGEDSLGIPLYKCVRGTSALEGFHQKIRQLVRGFNVSPYYAITLLFEYIHRWNHEIDVSILGLPTEYSCFYDQWEIDDEIEAVANWDELDKIAHEFIESICDVIGSGTGETFGVIGRDCGIVPKTEESEEDEIEQVVDALRDGLLTDEEANDAEVPTAITDSEAWLGSQLGFSAKRAPARVKTAAEKQFFADHYLTYTGGQDTAADSFTAINFSEFATFFNETIRAEEAGIVPATDMTLKTSYHLQAYWKDFKTDTNSAATLHQIKWQNTQMRQQWRTEERSEIPDAKTAKEYVDQYLSTDDSDINPEDSQSITEVAQDDNVLNDVSARNDVESQNSVQNTQIEINTELQIHTSSNQSRQRREASPAKEDGIEDPNGPTNPKKRGLRRCRKCGHPYKKYVADHQGVRFGKNVVQPHTVCTVASADRLEGYPLADAAKFPKTTA